MPHRIESEDSRQDQPLSKPTGLKPTGPVGEQQGYQDQPNETFEEIKKRIKRFLSHLRAARPQLEAILSEYQSALTTEDEFARIFECLETIDEVQGYLTRRTGSVAVFSPLNMTLYAIVLYGVFPALVADRVAMRVPERLAGLMRRLAPALDLPSYFPNLEVLVAISREDFVSGPVAAADAVIFTGRLENAQRVMARSKRGSLFIFNGWGANPIVVGEGADLAFAAAKTVDARLFGSGQDCAAPDTILVPHAAADAFLCLLQRRLAEVKVGPYADPEVRVGPLTDPGHIQVVASLLLRHADSIVHGGVIDFAAATVHPTVIVSPLLQQQQQHQRPGGRGAATDPKPAAMNFTELFAPVFFVSVYDADADLAAYFEHPSYVANEMYVSLFGRSAYVEGPSLARSIVLRDRVVFDGDRGNDEFGGRSPGASFVACNGVVAAQPVLVPREIFNHIGQRASSAAPLSPAHQQKAVKKIRGAMTATLGDELGFGFVFGSFAGGTASRGSDINVMVVLRGLGDPETLMAQADALGRALETQHRAQHEHLGLTFRPGRSLIFVTLEQLVVGLAGLEGGGAVVIDECGSTAESALDGAETSGGIVPPSGSARLRIPKIWLAALAGRQRGVAGDKSLCVAFGKRAMALLEEGSGGSPKQVCRVMEGGTNGIKHTRQPSHSHPGNDSIGKLLGGNSDWKTSAANHTHPVHDMASTISSSARTQESERNGREGGHGGCRGRERAPLFLKYRSSKSFITFVVTVAIFTDVFLYSLIIPILPQSLQDRAGIAPGDEQRWISIMLAVYAAANLIMSPIAGYLADHSSTRRAPLLAGLVALTGSTLMYMFGRSIWVLIAARALQGASAGVVWVVGLALLADTHGAGRAGAAMGWQTAGTLLGSVLGPAVAGVLYELAGHGAVFSVALGLLGVDVVLRSVMVERKVTARYRDGAGGDADDGEMEPLLPGNAASGGGAGPQGALGSYGDHGSGSQGRLGGGGQGSVRKQLATTMKLLTNRRLLIALWAIWCAAFILTSMESVLPLHVMRRFGWGPLETGLLFMTLAVSAVTDPLVGSLTDRHGSSRPFSILGTVCSALVFLMLCLAVTEGAGWADKAMLCGLLVLLGLAAGLLQVSSTVEISLLAAPAAPEGRDGEPQTLVRDDDDDDVMGRAYGMLNIAYGLGALAGPAVGGAVLVAAGWRAYCLVMAGMSAGTAVVVYLFGGE